MEEKQPSKPTTMITLKESKNEISRLNVNPDQSHESWTESNPLSLVTIIQRTKTKYCIRYLYGDRSWRYYIDILPPWDRWQKHDHACTQ